MRKVGWTELISSECSGARFFGGPVDISQQLDARIRSLGWITPQDTAHLNPASGNYEHYWERSQVSEVATLAVETLKLLGAQRVDDISFERNR